VGRRGLVGVAALLLLVGTMLVFRAFDRGSHSASDTLRPFVLTMAPVWIVFLSAAWLLARRTD
jgi:Na+-driven multidrug efflux pump